ncbi:MAG: bifunctional demethylmenaquinone methyltransferase/2-methoxy-6-polyprenyl-1,4-benzoquinol methylase UbiE [Acidiferrobacter sp.]
MDDTPKDHPTTHFGYREVDLDTKTRLVDEVFSSVAHRYDLMNDLMSGGLHRAWKAFAITIAAPRAHERVLDLASGSGDLARRLCRAVGARGQVVISDINRAMLDVGRDRLINHGLAGNLQAVQADAEQLPFPDGSFDLITIGFGLRNITRKERALQAMTRALRPGGRLVILEFSHPHSAILRRLYDLYSFTVVPPLGQLVAGDAASYRYLVESIRRHPDQAALTGLMQAAGLERVRHWNLMGGIVAVHRGYRI